MSHHKLSKAEVSLPTKSLKFCRATLEDLDKFGKKLGLKWHCRSDNRRFDSIRFRPKSTFNPPKSDAAIDLSLVKRFNLGPIKHKYNNLTREERKALYDQRNETSIIIKESNKGSVVVTWDKEDYLQETEKR